MTTFRGILFAAVAACAAQYPAHAITGCANQWLNGPYALQFSGALSAGSLGAGGIAAAGTVTEGSAAAGITRLTLSGTGVITGTNTGLTTYSFGTGALGGSAVRGNVSGTYSVGDDCALTLTLTDANGAIHHFSGAVVSAGGASFLVQTDAGSGVFANLVPARSSCNGFDLYGSFGLSSSGSVVRSGGNMNVNTAGSVSLGNGTGTIVTGVEYRYVGTLAKNTPTGSLVINSDCTVTLKTGSASYFGIVTSDLKQALLVQTDKDTSVIGSLTVQ